MKVSTLFLRVVLIFLLLTSSCAKLPSLNNFYADKNMKISKIQYQRLNNYLSKEFYSYQIKREVFAYPMAFLISSDGTKSLIIACNSLSNDCNLNIQIYQLIKKYERTQNIDFKILAIHENIISHEFATDKYKKYKKINKKNNRIFFDFLISPEDSCSGDDC